jgi:hypothetical protein
LVNTPMRKEAVVRKIYELKHVRCALSRRKEHCPMGRKCGIDVILAVVGGKWKSSILWHQAWQYLQY